MGWFKRKLKEKIKERALLRQNLYIRYKTNKKGISTMLCPFRENIFVGSFKCYVCPYKIAFYKEDKMVYCGYLKNYIKKFFA